MFSPTFDRMFRRQLNSEDTFCARDEKPCKWKTESRSFVGRNCFINFCSVSTLILMLCSKLM